MINKTKHKIIVFHPALAPYRIDFFNKLNEVYEAKFFFTFERVLLKKNNVLNIQYSAVFDQIKLKEQIQFNPIILKKGFTLFKREVRLGIFSILFKNKPDIVFCSEYSQITLFVLVHKYLFNKRYKIFTISDDSIDNSISRKGVRKLLRDKISYFIDGIILNSREVSNWYKENVNSLTKVFEIPIIHDNNKFRAKLNKSIKVSESNIKALDLIGKKIVLFVGRLVKEKNIELLITSFSKCYSEKNILVIIGDGIEKENLQHTASKLINKSNYIFTGRLEGEELISWYNIAQIFVLGSIFEPFGAVVNEALLGGCFVLCSNLAGASSLINNGKNGYIFDPFNENELTILLMATLKKSSPIQLPITLRNDLMLFTFQNVFNSFIQAINKLD